MIFSNYDTVLFPKNNLHLLFNQGFNPEVLEKNISDKS
jgi:hypothetical protein